jgi:hypothetical protein
MDVVEAEKRKRAEHEDADTGAEVAAVDADEKLADDDDRQRLARHFSSFPLTERLGHFSPLPLDGGWGQFSLLPLDGGWGQFSLLPLGEGLGVRVARGLLLKVAGDGRLQQEKDRSQQDEVWDDKTEAVFLDKHRPQCASQDARRRQPNDPELAGAYLLAITPDAGEGAGEERNGAGAVCATGRVGAMDGQDAGQRRVGEQRAAAGDGVDRPRRNRRQAEPEVFHG